MLWWTLLQLKLANATDRTFAANKLGNLKDPRAVGALVAALQDDEPTVRTAAARALGHIGTARAIKPLVAVLKDENPFTRETVAAALDSIDPSWIKSDAAKAVIPDTVALLKSESATVRTGAADALGRIGDARAVGPLVSVLNDKHPFTRTTVAGALDSIDASWTKSDAAKAAIPGMVVLLKNKDSEVQMGAASAIGYIGDARAVEPLIAVLKDKNASVRMCVTTALGHIGDARAVEPLIAALKDKDSSVRIDAAEALGHIGDRQAAKPLITALKDINPYVRVAAATALGHVGDARAIEPLVAVLAGEHSDARKAAAHALKAIGGPAAEEAVSQFDLREFRCGGCNRVLEEIGVPAQVSFLQGYRQVFDTGSQSVPSEITADPYLYRGFYCPTCNEAFCPPCAGMQSELCPRCHQPSLMPGYRPLLKRIAIQA